MLTEKPASWKFELETPEIGNPEAETIFHAEAAEDTLESILFDGQVFDFTGPLNVDAKARWAGNDLAVSVRISAVLSSPCSRCLEPSRIEILNDFMYLYSLRKKGSSHDSFTDDGLQVIHVQRWQRFFDVSDQVWEGIIVSLPVKVLCSPQCRGLCPKCGRPLNSGSCTCSSPESDPRMEKLLGIKIEDIPE